MNSKINFSKIKGCNQIWDSMPECEKGRICGQCDNVIFDFRGKTEWEIALKHAQSETKVCGIYDEKMLAKNKDSGFLQTKKKGLLVAGTLGLLATNSPAFSQNDGGQFQTEFVAEDNKVKISDESDLQNRESQNSNSSQIDSTLEVTGRLVDEHGEPLIGATILIKGTEKGTITGIDGEFFVDLTEELTESDTITIVASYIGYGREEKTIFRSDFIEKNKLEIKLKMNEQAHLISFTVRRPPLHKRIWNKLKSIF